MRNTPSSRAFPPSRPPRRHARTRTRPANQRLRRRAPQRAALHQIVLALRHRLGTLVPALALLSLTLVLAVGCSLSPTTGGTTGSGTGGARSTITPPPTPPGGTQLTPGPAQPITGSPAITPHLSGVPAFTTDDMANYVKGHGLPTNFGGGSPTIAQNTFLSSDAVGQALNMPGGPAGLRSDLSGLSSQPHRLSAASNQAQSAAAKPSDAKLVGLVVLKGNFVWPGATNGSTPPTSPYAYEIFDAKTGNLLLYGGLTQPPNTQPNATPTPTSPPTGGPTPTPRSQPPTPTNTPAPQCNPIASGTGPMNVDNVYLNVDSGASPTNPGHVAAGAHVQWSPAAGNFAPINFAMLSDKGKIGAAGFAGLTCADLKGASYAAATTAPAANDEVFLVKTSGGHYAKVLVSGIVLGALGPTVQWETFS